MYYSGLLQIFRHRLPLRPMALNNIESVQVLFSKVNSFLLTFKHLSGTKWVWLVHMAQVLQQRNQQQLVGNCEREGGLLQGSFQHLEFCGNIRFCKSKQEKKNLRNGKPVNQKGNHPWVFIARTDAEAEALILCPPAGKTIQCQLIGNNPEVGKYWGQEEKGVTEDETVGWHHRLGGHELEQTPGDSKGQGILACCSPWDHTKSDTTYRLNNNKHVSQWKKRHMLISKRLYLNLKKEKAKH